ncbi:uncharacterized protein PV07_10558 [Cladophialophora immunda]|uniref:Uncharacterized protein n=1 Tax=Cladophialophora immunda TaxID=569365 RepID=A0A0D1ZAY5_9EURO|nr:uncharacterized protein PV07_10558 [Cladophialophora immunda]KIW24871.1 hypothetical protein PV07_10558 [Cladophialophora immunda]
MFHPDLTPEDVAENWDSILGETGDGGQLLDVFEQSQPREERLIEAMLEEGKIPELTWLAQQPVQDSNMVSMKQ